MNFSSLENVVAKLDPRSQFDLFTKILILRAWKKYQDIFYLASKFRCKPDCILDVIENRRVYLKTWQAAVPFKANDTYPYHTPCFVAIELILAEWLRRARQNRINLTTNLFQRSTEFISGYVGYPELTYSIWNRYLENKYQIDSTQAQAREDALTVTEERRSMNFGDIINDVIKYYGDNIIFPNGRPMHATSSTEDSKTSFDNPFYVTIEQILCEWVKRAQNNDIDITVRSLEKMAKYAATAINFVDFTKIPEWIDSFKCKYKITTTAHTEERKDSIYFINNPPLVIDNIINVFRNQYGYDIIPSCKAPREDTPTTSRKRSRKSSPSITVNNSNSTPLEVSHWITKTPGYIALELILTEWIKRTQYNGEAISQFRFDEKVRRFVLAIKFNVPHRFSIDWLPIFNKKYKILFSKTPRLPKRDNKNRVSTTWNDIISDLCELYGESVIMARPGQQHELLDPCIAAEISRSHTAFQLIADEWMKRCQHNGFIITNYNLTAVTQSIASYLKCKSDRIISFWLKITKKMLDKVDIPLDICPYKVNFQPTNVHLIIKDLYKIHGDEKIPPESHMSVKEAREKRMCPHSAELDDDSHLDGDAAKRIREEGYGDSVQQTRESRLPDDIDTGSLVDVYVTEDSTDASEFGQMYVVKTEPELNGHENESTDASEFGQMDIVKTEPELSDLENASKQSSAKLDDKSRLDEVSAKRIAKESCRDSAKLEVDSHLDGNSAKRITEEGYRDSVPQIQEVRLPGDIDTESLVDVYVTEDSTDASEFGQMYVVETEPELHGYYIPPCTAAREDTPRTSRKRSRKSSLSITVNNSNATPMEVSSWITKTPGYIALELILSEWIKRTQHNGEAISQFRFRQRVRRFVSAINFNIPHSFSTDWLPIFKQKYKIVFTKTPRLPKRDDKNRVSTTWNDIISDLCELYGESVIMARPGPQHELLDPCIAAEISRSHTAFQLIANEWMKRCRHNGFIITNYYLTTVIQSIASYLKCENDRIISFWLKIAKKILDKVDNPWDICPYKVKFQPTNVHLIIKDLYKIHGDVIPPESHMSVKEAREKRMCPDSAEFDDDSHLDGDAAKRIREISYDDSVPQIQEIRLPDDIQTESFVDVYVTEDSTDASEFGQISVVKTEPELNGHENEATHASEVGQMDIVKTEPEWSDHENANKQTSAKLDDDSRLDRDSAKRITKEGCRDSVNVEVDSHLNGDSAKRIKEEGFGDSVQEIRLPDDIDTESLVDVYVTEDSTDASEFDQMYVVKTEPELNDHENASKQYPTIGNYHDAIEYLQPLEKFIFINEDMRAVGLINQLENMLKDRI